MSFPGFPLFACLILVCAGCGGSASSTELSVRIVSGYGKSGSDRSFTLRCQPTGGDIPNREALCRMIEQHPQAMLFPGRPRSTCIGGMNVPPSVSVAGSAEQRSVKFSARVLCEWPGGAAAFAYWAAANSGGDLARAAGRLRCDEDPALLRMPTSWARARACLRGRG